MPPSGQTQPTPPRWWGQGLAVLGLALAVRAWVLPALSRHGWEGHEAEYLAVFQGDWHGAWSTRIVPLLGWCYRLLGRVSDHEQTLVLLSLSLSLLSIAALAVLVRRLGGPGLLAALLVTLYGNHAFWSSSAYNVIAPHALWLCAFAALTWRGWPAVVLSGLLLGAAAGTRFELVVLVPAACLLLGRHSWPRRGVWVLCVATVQLGCLLPVLEPGAHPAGLLSQAAGSLGERLLEAVFLAPWASGAGMALAVGLAAIGAARFRRLGSIFVVIALLAHGTAAAFADSGYRQALTTGVALCALQALGIAALAEAGRRQARRTLQAAAALALLVTVGLLAQQTIEVGRRYYAPSSPLMAELQAEAPGPVSPSALEGCRELNTQPDPAAPGGWRLEGLDQGACWLWFEDWQHRRWTSLGVHDRAHRVHHRYRTRALGMTEDPTDPGRPPRQVWLLEARR
jgi:hypothetical protein